MERNRVLLVDDDVLNHWIMTESLVDAGFSVTGRSRGLDAAAALQSGQCFDILVTDFQLPDGICGFELAAEWRRLLPGRPIIYTSTFARIAIGALADDEAFVAKYLGGEELLALIALLTQEAQIPLLSTRPPRALYVH